MNKTTICLNMIVRDEALVIRRCLESVKPLIDTWVIVDTGSQDGTQEIIREFLKDIPGDLFELPWVDFGHNRNEALSLARGKADYFLFIDADDRLIFDDGFISLPSLDRDCYFIIQHTAHEKICIEHSVIFLLKDLPELEWKGAVHEALEFDDTRTTALLRNIVNEYRHEGCRARDPEKHTKDILMLERHLHDTRNVFYLAQTHLGARNYPLALKYYEQRAAMGGREDEIFYSMFSAGVLQQNLRCSSDCFIKSYCDAYLFRQRRMEPLLEIARYYIEKENYFLAFLILRLAAPSPKPKDLFVQSWVYEWGIDLHLFLCAIQLEEHEIAYNILVPLLDNPHFPSHLQKKNEVHLSYLEAILKNNKIV